MASSFTVWKFDSPTGADEALQTLEALQREQLIEVLDAAVVSWPQGAKKPKTRQLHNMAGAGALGGAFWGLLFGLLFFIPLIGLAIGAGMGALMGSMADVGIDDNMIKQMREKITMGTSALFLLSQNAVQDRVAERVQNLKGHVELIQSNLTKEQEEKLRDVFGDEAMAAAAPSEAEAAAPAAPSQPEATAPAAPSEPAAPTA
jgi:uncharacterized membrane protein